MIWEESVTKRVAYTFEYSGGVGMDFSDKI